MDDKYKEISFFIFDKRLPPYKFCKLFAELRVAKPEILKAVSDFLSKKIKPDDSLAIMLNPFLKDVEILNKVRDLTSSLRSTSKPQVSGVGREESRIKQIERWLLIKKDPTYLDIGCSEGKITDAVVKFLKIPKEKAFACDIMPIASIPTTFSFSLNTSDRLPFRDSMFDIVTMFMSAHHFNENTKKMFEEARRVMKTGGILILREHGIKSQDQAVFLDIVHAIYETCFGDETTPEKFVESFKAHYRGIDEWKNIITQSGFEITEPPSKTNDRFFSVLMAFRAIDIDRLSKVLRIFKPKHLLNESFVRDIYKKSMKQIEQNTRLYLPSTADKDAVSYNLMYRVPVYFGKPQTDLYDDEALKREMGYDTSLTNKLSVATEANIQYAICGPVFSHPRNYSNTFVIHLWGLNFESSETAHYKVYGNSITKNIKLIKRFMHRMFVLMASSTGNVDTGTKKFIRLPLIGLGRFIEALDEEDQSLMRKTFFESLEEVASNYLDITFDVCGSVPSTPPSTPNVRYITNGDLFDVSSYKKADNLFLVNAWDPKSFIGNGGSRDNSIDGYMISSSGPGEKFSNTSFLHDPHICTSLLDPSKWVRVDIL